MQRKAQSIAEYALVIGIALTAMMGIQVYLQRGIQAHIKEGSDTLGLQKDWRQADIRKGGAIEDSHYNTSSNASQEYYLGPWALGGRIAARIDKEKTVRSGNSSSVSEAVGF